MGALTSKFKRSKKKQPYTAYKDRNFKQKATESLWLQDIFAEPISLNFRGKKAFSSKAGMFISLLVRVSILLFAMTRYLSMLQRPSDIVQSVESQVDFDLI